jgi:hypothetical protein
VKELTLPYPPTPEHAADLAEVCVDAARKVSGADLDFSPESLSWVESQLDKFVADGCGEDDIAATLFCFGCYVGEVLIRSLGGHWERTEDSSMAGLADWPLVTMMENGDGWNPIGKVFKRFNEGQPESIVYFFDVARSGSRPRNA